MRTLPSYDWTEHSSPSLLLAAAGTAARANTASATHISEKCFMIGAFFQELGRPLHTGHTDGVCQHGASGIPACARVRASDVTRRSVVPRTGNALWATDGSRGTCLDVGALDVDHALPS